jgi:hypothetical protein
MAQCFQDAMSIVRVLGKPDLFATFTANPNWEEITETLYDNQTAFDRSDLIARAFHRRLQYLIEDIKSGAAFGSIAYLHSED